MKHVLRITGLVYIIVLVLLAVFCFALGGAMAGVNTNDHEMQANSIFGAIVEGLGVGLAAGLSIVIGILFLIIGGAVTLFLILFLIAYIRDFKGKNTRGYCIFLSVIGAAATVAVIVVAVSQPDALGVLLMLVATLPLLAYGIMSAEMQRKAFIIGE